MKKIKEMYFSAAGEAENSDVDEEEDRYEDRYYEYEEESEEY